MQIYCIKKTAQNFLTFPQKKQVENNKVIYDYFYIKFTKNRYFLSNEVKSLFLTLLRLYDNIITLLLCQNW